MSFLSDRRERGIPEKNHSQEVLLQERLSGQRIRNLTMLKLHLLKIQPSQLFISEEKLSRVMQRLNPEKPETLEPIPVKKLGGEIIYTDGHTRALAAHQRGFTEIPIVWDKDELDWEAYEICVHWCKEEGILTIADLEDRILDPGSYERLWINRCREMHKQLEAKREQRQA